MLGKQAKILASRDVADLLAFAECGRHPLRNRVMDLLSAKAGLRAGEIAGLIAANDGSASHRCGHDGRGKRVAHIPAATTTEAANRSYNWAKSIHTTSR